MAPPSTGAQGARVLTNSLRPLAHSLRLLDRRAARVLVIAASVPRLKGKLMTDLIFAAATIAFFAGAIAYSSFCDKLHGGGRG